MLDMRYEILNKNSPLKRGGWCVLGIVVILFISSCSTEPQQKTKPKKPKAQPQMTSTNEEDWSSKSKPTIIKAPKDADHDLN